MLLSRGQDQDLQHNPARVLLLSRFNQRGNTEIRFRRNYTQGKLKIISLRNELSCAGQIHHQIDLPRMGITLYNHISTKHQKRRGIAPGGCITILNKQEGGALYQNMRDSLFFDIAPPFLVY